MNDRVYRFQISSSLYLVDAKEMNPFTLKSDQFQISTAASPEISHSMKNSLKILRWKMIILPIILTNPLIRYSLALSLPQVINFKFPLQPHKK